MRTQRAAAPNLFFWQAAKIQASFRGRKTRAKAVELKEQKVAATRLQAMVRGKRQRASFHDVRKSTSHLGSRFWDQEGTEKKAVSVNHAQKKGGGKEKRGRILHTTRGVRHFQMQNTVRMRMRMRSNAGFGRAILTCPLATR